MAEPTESYEDFVSQILRPTNISNLKSPVKFEKVSIIVYKDGAEEELEFENIYPFYTVSDLSTMIYSLKESKEEFHPQNQCLLIKTATGKFINLKYLFNKTNAIEFVSPLELAASGKANPKFVDLEGNPQIQDITSRDQMLLETVLFKKVSSESDVYTIHLFLYSDILKAYPGLRPINRVDWEGIFKVYFPEADKEHEDGSLSDAQAAYAPVRLQRFLERQRIVEVLDQALVEEMPLRRPGESSRGDSINFSNVRNLRFTWDKPRFVAGYQPFRLESVFYDMPVSQTVPYIRYYPTANSSTPISKVHVEGPLNIPTMEDAQILQKWSQERPLLPEEEFLMAKILIRPGSGSVNPLYASLFMFQDGQAMFAIQPNTDTKSLSKEADLYNLVPILNTVMKSVPGLQPKLGKALPVLPVYSPSTVKLTDAYVVLSLWLDKEDTEQITQRSLYKVLPFFRPFFQVTSSPIKEQNPIAFLRYKGVNNFQTPSRDFQFLIRVLDLQKMQGQTSLPTLVKFYKEEFDVSDEVANRRVTAFLNDREKYDMTDPENLEYTQSENPGIDVAIFGKHPFYTFHIYRVDSKITLERIKTLLSLLVSVSPSLFSEHSAEVLAQEEAEASAEAEAEAEANAPEAEEAPASAEGEAKSLTVAAAALNAPAEQELAMVDDGLGDFGGFGDEEAEESPAQDLKSLAEADSPEVAPKAEPKATVAKAKAKEKEKAKDEDEDDEITDISQIKQQPSRIYFRKRLQFYDRKLFSYSKTHPSLKKYPSMCAANALKQPTVLTEGEFERMKDTYSEDIEAGRVTFKEYPVKKGDAQKGLGAGAGAGGKKTTSKTEIITSLRYGSNLLPGQANIFICSEFWCRNDDIVVLRDDFEKTVDRKGKPKAKNTCPFCRGGLVLNRDMIVEGESVIQRLGKGKEAGDKKHLFINFLKKTPHPQGLYLPCCFISDHLIEDKHPAYEPLTKKAQSIVGLPQEPVVAALAAEVQAAQQEVPFLPKPKQDEVKLIAVDYKSTLTDIFSDSMTDRPYIVGAEKLPLELTKKGPQIGIVPKGVDTYFTQDSLGTATKPGLVVQDHTVWKLMIDNTTKKPKATGFFRMAAENNKRNQPEAFLAAIAPYFGENSAAAMKRRILELVQPNIFLSLNYGNFLFDFYNPMTPDPKQIGIIREFAQKRLLVDFLVGTPKELVIRAWKGFMGFTTFMADTTKVKEYRQFANMLALPNLFQWEDFSDIQRSNGILFIVLEVAYDNSVEVRCPPYGVSKATLNCDIAFILHYASGIWEPLFHIRSDEDVSEITTVFTRDTYASWPSIVKQRVKEFENLCHSSGLGMYTDSPSVKATSLMPLSVAMNIEETEVYGIMRDIYNHVSFVIYKQGDAARLGPGAAKLEAVPDALVLVPVVDDGTVYPSTRIVVEWKSLFKKLATVDVVKAFYEKYIQPALETEVQKMSYQPGTVFRLDKTDDFREYINALQLQIGLHVPVKLQGEEGEDMAEGSEISWSIDRKIAFGSLTADASLTVDHKEFEEIYQHLRFSFANWFSLAPATFKTEINKIIFKDGGPNIDLPLYEKRQRLSIKLKKEIEGWLDSSASRPNRQPSLKRIDCRVTVEEGGCKDRCVWKADTASPRCLLHTPETFDLGVKQVSAIDLLINRLIEELIRFPLKRDELLNQRVSQYVKLSEAFRSGNQYIVPEDLPAWSELLRMDWTKKSESKYIEEYTAIEPQDFVAEDAVTSFQTKDIPELATMFGPDFFFIEEGSGSITKIIEDMGIPGTDLEAIGQTPDAPIVEPDIATYIAKELKYSFYQLLYAPGNPAPEEPLSVKLQLNVKTTAPFLIIVKLPDERVGVISKSTTLDPIELTNLPPKVRVSVTKMFTKV